MPLIAITGATGFLGSNIAQVCLDAGWDVLGLTRSEPTRAAPWRYAVGDTHDSSFVSRACEGAEAIVHTAIANDFARLDAHEAYSAYPGLTTSVTRAAVEIGATPVYISTDWVMDGSSHLEAEASFGRPINTYGFLKALGEQVVRDLAPDTGVICRIGGVMGHHQLQASLPRSQDVGFGYFVAALVEALQAGSVFQVFSGEGVNQVATPSLASEIGATILRILSVGARGHFHVVSDDAVTRRELAQLACEVFELNPSLITEGPPSDDQRFDEPVPVDTSLSNSRLHEELGIGPVPLRGLLEALRAESDGRLHPLTTT